MDDGLITETLRNSTIDSIWRRLGKLGKFQVTQSVFLLLCFTSAWHTFSILFIGYTPDFVCNKPDNSTDFEQNYGDENISTIYSKCHIKRLFTNGTCVEETGCVFAYNYSESAERSIVSEWNLVCEKDTLSGFTQSLFVIGQAVGSAAAGISDKVGRRPTHIVSHGLLFAVLCGTAFVQSYWSFAILRFITGIVMAISDCATWTTILETIPNEHRAFLGGVAGICWSLYSGMSIPVAYFLEGYSWRITQLALSMAALHFVFAVFIMEESLCWLIATENMAPAVKLFKKACCMNGIVLNDTFSSGSSLIKYQKDNVALGNDGSSPETSLEDRKFSIPLFDLKSEPPETSANLGQKCSNVNGSTNARVSDTVFMIVKDGILLKHTVIISLVWFVNVLVYHGLFLTSSIISDNRYLQFLLSSLAEVPAALFSWYTMYRFGRRFTCILGIGIAGVTLLSSTLLSAFADSDAVGIFKTVLVIIGKFGVSSSYNSLIIYIPELYPTTLRNTGMGIASLWACVAGTLSPYSDNLAKVASWLPGTIFASTSILVASLMKFLPETNGTELPQTIAELHRWETTKTNKKVSHMRKSSC